MKYAQPSLSYFNVFNVSGLNSSSATQIQAKSHQTWLDANTVATEVQ